MKTSINLRPEGDETPLGIASVEPMDDDGDMVIGLRPYGAHPDAEVCIVTIRVEQDGTFVVLVMDGEGGALASPVSVKREGA